MAMRVVTLGADPEFPIIDRNRGGLGGKFLPVCGLIGGTKGKPVPHPLMPEIGGWLEDGAMVELNPAPAQSTVRLASNIAHLYNKLNEMLAPDKRSLYVTDYATFDKRTLEAFPQACEFGCAPDVCAYEPGVPRNVPMAEAMEMLGDGIRFAGGHVHLGVSDWPEALPKFVAAKFLDLFLLLPSLSIWEPNKAGRHAYYGLPGLYRETSYGLEYRSPSNKWMNEILTDDIPFFLGRLKAIGKTFAEFERHREDMVRLYNQIDWHTLREGIIRLDWDEIKDAIPPQVKREDRIPFGDYLFYEYDHRSTRGIDGRRLANTAEAELDTRQGNLADQLLHAHEMRMVEDAMAELRLEDVEVDRDPNDPEF